MSAIDRAEIALRQAKAKYEAVEGPAWDAYARATRATWEAYDAARKQLRDALEANRLALGQVAAAPEEVSR